MKPWITFFSQTGSEIYKLSKLLNRVPDKIITNKPLTKSETINFDLFNEYFDVLYFVNSKPTVEEYFSIIPEGSLVTMHGWLRIMPPEVCEKYEIYNLHPAPLVVYPHLKGKDPQIRIFEEGLAYSGNTIHKCIAELDAGPISAQNIIHVKDNTLDEIFVKTHEAATELWFDFLKNRL